MVLYFCFENGAKDEKICSGYNYSVAFIRRTLGDLFLKIQIQTSVGGVSARF
jgi:hypothetical protein